MYALYVLLLGILVSQSVIAQTDLEPANHIVRHSFADYDEEILYFGKHNQYYTVRTYLKNGSLFRLDSYTVGPKMLPNGFQLDSLSRIARYGPTKIMYPNGKVYISCEYKDNMLHGPFMVMYEDGSVKRREYYKVGTLRKSECYTADGTKQPCTPFYQVAQFQGKPTDLSAYLKQKLSPVLDGERIRRITATLTINEIGQVIGVKATVNGNPAESVQMPDVVSYTQQVIRNMPEWTPDKLNWKPALNDGVATPSTCVLSVYRIYGSVQYNIFYRM
ncbi:toxin-antitoxin system YwqK family antitoxin [Spirosoma lituiforme]